MDIIQQIMIILTELIERIRDIFAFVNSQFLPPPDEEITDEKDYLKKQEKR